MRRRLLPAIAFAIAGVACSGPPAKEHQEAESALAAARAAHAAIYAPADLKLAESAFASYDAAVAQRDYRQALRLAIEARDGAFTAARRAGEEKGIARVRADQQVADLEALIKTANTRLTAPASSRPPAAQAARIRASLKAATPVLQKARSLVAAEDYAGAIAAVSPAIDAIRKDFEVATPQPGRRGR